MPLYPYTTRQIVQPYAMVGLTSAFLAYTNKVKSTATENLIAYWPLADQGGTVIADESGNGRVGAYTAVTLNATGINDGRTATGFDASTSKANVFSSPLATAFNGLEGALMLWAQVNSAGTWTDATQRRLLRLLTTGTSAISIVKSTSSNQLNTSYNANGTTESVNVTSFSPTTWFHVALTWSKAADEYKAYINGAQTGSTQTTLGTWANTVNFTMIGASSATPTEVWDGRLAHVAVWTTTLSAAQILALASLP